MPKDLDWGELRSLSAQLSHPPQAGAELTLWALCTLLIKAAKPQREQGLSYLRDLLQRQQDDATTLAQLEHLLKHHKKLKAWCALVKDQPEQTPALLWHLLNDKHSPLLGHIAAALLADAEDEHGTSLSALILWVLQGEQALHTRICTHHNCKPKVSREFLCAWAFGVLDSPTSSPPLSIDGDSSSVWEVKAWPEDYNDPNAAVSDEGWAIVVDSSNKDTLSTVDMSAWQGIKAHLEEFKQALKAH